MLQLTTLTPAFDYVKKLDPEVEKDILKKINIIQEVADLFPDKSLKITDFISIETINKYDLVFMKEFNKLLILSSNNYSRRDNETKIVKTLDMITEIYYSYFTFFTSYQYRSQYAQNPENLVKKITKEQINYLINNIFETSSIVIGEYEKSYYYIQRDEINIDNFIERIDSTCTITGTNAEELKREWKKILADDIISNGKLKAKIPETTLARMQKEMARTCDSEEALKLNEQINKEDACMIVFNEKISREDKLKILKEKYIKKNQPKYLNSTCKYCDFEIVDLFIEGTIENNGRIRDKGRSKAEYIFRNIFAPSNIRPEANYEVWKRRCEDDPRLEKNRKAFMIKYKDWICKYYSIIVDEILRNYTAPNQCFKLLASYLFDMGIINKMSAFNLFSLMRESLNYITSVIDGHLSSDVVDYFSLRYKVDQNESHDIQRKFVEELLERIGEKKPFSEEEERTIEWFFNIYGFSKLMANYNINGTLLKEFFVSFPDLSSKIVKTEFEAINSGNSSVFYSENPLSKSSFDALIDFIFKDLGEENYKNSGIGDNLDSVFLFKKYHHMGLEIGEVRYYWRLRFNQPDVLTRVLVGLKRNGLLDSYGRDLLLKSVFYPFTSDEAYSDMFEYASNIIIGENRSTVAECVNRDSYEDIRETLKDNSIDKTNLRVGQIIIYYTIKYIEKMKEYVPDKEKWIERAQNLKEAVEILEGI